MADRGGYIGRNPGDSSVIVAKQTFEPTGVQTDFTFSSGYTPGNIDVYLNGSRLIVASDYTATDGSVVGLTSAAGNGDVLECVAYKAFNLGNVTNATGNFTVGGNLTVSGTTTLGTIAAGASVSYATTSFGLEGSPNLAVGVVTATSFYGNGENLTGVAATDYVVSNTLKVLGISTFVGASTFTGDVSVGGASTFTGTVTVGNITGTAATFSGNVSIGGTLTYEDVTNVDSVGIITARAGINVSGGEFKVGTALTIGSAGVVTATSYYGDGQYLTGISAGISTGAASGGQVTLDLTNQDHKVTASGVTTITCSGGTEGDSHTVRITNSGITTVGFSTYFLWPSGAAPSIPSTSGTISLISFTIQRVGTAGTQLLAGASLDFS